MAATKASMLKKAAAETVAGNLKAGARPMAQGVGESKLFGGGGKTPDLSAFTVNGEPIPPECWDTFPISLTDQGKADMDRERRALPVNYTGRDRTDYSQIFDDDKKALKFADDRLDTEGLVIARDPFAPLIDRHTPPGHRAMFLSPKKCSQEGLVRGVLEYKPVMIPNPETGVMERVTCGGMFLASVPLELANKSERYYRSLNSELQVKAVEKVQSQVDQVMTDGGMRDFARRRNASDALVGLETEDQQSGDAEMLREALAHE